MTIDYEELAGSPKLVASQQSVSAVRSFRVPWDQWQALARLLLGVSRTTAGMSYAAAPVTFPGFEHLLATEVAVEPFDPDAPDSQPELDLHRHANTYRSGARVTVTYQAVVERTLRGRRDLPQTPGGTYLIYRGELGLETLRTPGRLWRWSVDDHPPVPDDVNPSVVIPTGNVHLTWLRVPLPPWNAQRALRGKVNDGPFLGAPAGTVLFLGARAVREFQFLDDGDLWRIDYHFAEQTKPLTGGGQAGWNHHYKEEAEDDEHWVRIEDADGNPPYAAGDFSALFAFE